MFYPDESGLNIDRNAALELSRREGTGLFDLFALANRVRDRFRGHRIDLCSIVNAKSGACPEDCSFCAQSAHSRTSVEVYPLSGKDKIIRAAESAKSYGVRRFCIVTSGKKPAPGELKEICGYVRKIRDIGLLPCATLGMIDAEEMRQLKDAGLERYHHNLETSESFFSEICSTHTYSDKIRTIESAKAAGLSMCSGGIFGLGESWEDRIDMAFALKEIGVESIPVNFLSPISGTPLEGKEVLDPLEALKIISIFRLVCHETEIRVCGGRPATLRDMNSFIFNAGADGLLLGNYLTTSGRLPEDDLRMIRDAGFEI